jgi:type I restriction enzyme S subunit
MSEGALALDAESSQIAVERAPLPKNWRWARLGDLLSGSGQYGTSQRADATASTGLPVLGMSNIHEGKIRWENLKFIALPAAEIEKYRLIKGDILFNRTNSAELVGKTAVFDGSRDAVFASYLIRLRVTGGMANPDFIAAYINSEGGRRFIEARMARAIGQVNISASTIITMPIPLPPITEQERIAAILKEQMAAVERARTAAESQLKEINKLPAAFLRQAFTGQL